MNVFVIFQLLMLAMQTGAMSIDKHIFDAGESAEMFDRFHVMPEGVVKVFHELDMILSVDQYKELYMDEKYHPKDRAKRKARADSRYRWSNCTVYFEVTESLGLNADRESIDQAIAEWEKYTCLRFVESDSAPQRILFKSGTMCASQVGMQQEPQVIELAPGCRTKGVVAHEIGHAIGWYHEHMRPDRDDYITVNFENIKDRFRYNYKKYKTHSINTYGVEYSYLSLMHYGGDFFSFNAPGPAITTKDPAFQNQIGQRTGLSFKDIKLANAMYDCARTMNCTPKNCGYGFQFHKDFDGHGECLCVCDSGNLQDPLKICSKEDENRKTTPVPMPQTVATTTITTSAKPDEKCEDMRNDCHERKGDCMTKMATMMTYCPKTCGFCGRGEGMCMDSEYSCGAMTAFCNIAGFEETMTSVCRASCGKCAKPPPDACDMFMELTGIDKRKASSNTERTFGVWSLLWATVAASLGWVLSV